MASGSFSFPPKRPDSGRGGGPGRPTPQRVNSAGMRAAPYQRPPPATTADGRWQHDLFGGKANAHANSSRVDTAAVRAQLNQKQALSPPVRSSGRASPAARPFAGSVPSGPQAGNTGVHSMGIKGQKAAALQRQAEVAARSEREALARQRKELERKREETVKIAEQEQQGFVVQVEGLVSGTSAEDVQTAFSAYGDIVYCFVVDPTATDLIARLTFSRFAEATDACKKLDGAIADGRPLRVKQVDRTAVPDPLPPLAPSPPSSSTPAVASQDAFSGVPTGPRAQRRTAVEPTVPVPKPIAPPSKMYADQIEALQQQARSMDVDMAQAVPTGPRSGRGGARNGHASGAAGGGAVPLVARFSGAGAGAKGPQQQSGGLAARLGVVAGGQQQQQQRQGGTAGGAKGGAQTSSLLARLK